MKKWEPTGAGNFILEKGDWYVSYNPDTNFSSSLSILGFINSLPVDKITGKEVSEEETCLNINDVNLILNGDFRKDYEKLSTKEEALAFYNSKKEKYQSAWSEDLND